jgi:hypothetical protein
MWDRIFRLMYRECRFGPPLDSQSTKFTETPLVGAGTGSVMADLQRALTGVATETQNLKGGTPQFTAPHTLMWMWILCLQFCLSISCVLPMTTMNQFKARSNRGPQGEWDTHSLPLRKSSLRSGRQMNTTGKCCLCDLAWPCTYPHMPSGKLLNLI